MESQLKQFTAPSGAQLRTISDNGTVYFVGKDAAQMLGYTNPQKAIRDHVEPEDKTVNESFTVNGTAPTLINESGLYSLILSSKLPEAKQFKRWVTSEVLPAIRRDGGYIATTGQETQEELIARALIAANEAMNRQKERLAALEQQNQEQALELAQQDVAIKQQQLALDAAAPKVTFADAVAQSDNCILIGELAKLIRQNGIDMGMNRLFRWLRANKYLMRDNRPTQRSMERGLFRVIERSIVDASGNTRLCLTTKVTGKGQQYFINLFLSKAI
jgi:anti-repressor protein